MGGWEAVSRVRRGCRARQRMANPGGAKGQMILIGIPDMLRCVPVLVPLRILLLYSQHIPSQNETRLLSCSCMLNILRQCCLTEQLSNTLCVQVSFSDELKPQLLSADDTVQI